MSALSPKNAGPNVTRLQVSHSDSGDSLWDRAPHLFEFVSQISVWRRNEAGEWAEVGETRRLAMVPLHMKANVCGETLGRRRREKEARTLCQALADLGASLEESLILIGDTNILSSAEPAVELLFVAGFIDLNNHDAPTFGNYMSKGAPFDRTFVRKDRREFKYSRQYVLHSTDVGAHDKLLVGSLHDQGADQGLCRRQRQQASARIGKAAWTVPHVTAFGRSIRPWRSAGARRAARQQCGPRFAAGCAAGISRRSWRRPGRRS
jgi:hypothetical protein